MPRVSQDAKRGSLVLRIAAWASSLDDSGKNTLGPRALATREPRPPRKKPGDADERTQQVLSVFLASSPNDLSLRKRGVGPHTNEVRASDGRGAKHWWSKESPQSPCSLKFRNINSIFAAGHRQKRVFRPNQPRAKYEPTRSSCLHGTCASSKKQANIFVAPRTLR